MNKQERKRFYKSKAWQVTRMKVLERDNYECVMCRKEGKVNIKQNNPDKHKTLDIDHIKPLEHYPELGYDMDNLQTLCIRHHNEKENRFNKTQSKKKRWQDEWW